MESRQIQTRKASSITNFQPPLSSTIKKILSVFLANLSASRPEQGKARWAIWHGPTILRDQLDLFLLVEAKGNSWAFGKEY